MDWIRSEYIQIRASGTVGAVYDTGGKPKKSSIAVAPKATTNKQI
jgi:hypothetical protein